MMNSLKLLYHLLNAQDKRYLSGLLVLSIFISILETVSISAIMVFISVATNFNLVYTSKTYSWLYAFIGMHSPAQFVIILGFFLIAFYVVRGITGVIHVYLFARFSFTRYHRFATLLFNRFLRFSYYDFIGKNSAEVGQVIFSHSGGLTHLIFALLTMISELFTVLCIYTMLFWVNWKMTVVLTLLLSVKGFFIIKTFSKGIAKAGKKTHQYSLDASKVFNESYGNFKLIKLSLSEVSIGERFSKTTQAHASTQIMYTTLQNSPRFILETVGFVLLVGAMLYVIYRYNNASFVIPVVSMYALAFYRLLPSMNKILANAHQITFFNHALQGIVDFLQKPTENLGKQQIAFNRQLTLHNLSFSYIPECLVISNVDITINKGERVAFVGASGSGKSTLVDVIMGLHVPSKGFISIDGKLVDDACRQSWRSKIGYIPQTIYLFDGTVKDNIVFGRSYNEQKLIHTLKQARMYDFLLTQQGLDTCVGDGGVKLSGGQKQRIAIARALYGDPELLVLDEATSALDHDTESCIMNEIYQLARDVTLIIIAHRHSTVLRCDTIYKIEHGQVQKISTSEVLRDVPLQVRPHDGV